VPEIAVYQNALPVHVFRQLASAVREIGDEQLDTSYATNFWFDLHRHPSNLAEEAILQLVRLAQPGSACIGAEWWLGRLKHGQSLALHEDRDLSLHAKTGEIRHPLRSSILYLNRFRSSPTVILPSANSGKSIAPEPNRYIVYRGDLQHGVLARRSLPAPRSLRLTFLVNFWDRRPLPPVCRDYDGRVYGALKDQWA
jgi:hypothetical protein